MQREHQKIRGFSFCLRQKVKTEKNIFTSDVEYINIEIFYLITQDPNTPSYSYSLNSQELYNFKLSNL